MRFSRFAVCITAASLTCGAALASAADWMQFGYDAAHTGVNPKESTINTGNVANLATMYSVSIPSGVDSAPVYLSNVTTPNGTKNLLFALSKTGRVMAIDAATGTEIWHATTTGTQPTTASPAVDPGRQYVYSYGTDGKAHKYQVGDGTEITDNNWPEVITLKNSVEKGAGGLTIANDGTTNYLVVVTDGYIGDGGDYQGHLVSINLDTGTQNVFNVMCSDVTEHFTTTTPDCSSRQSGIWGRGGATFDAATSRVYISTGNGQFNASTGGFNWGDSVLALAVDGTGSGGGMPRDSYTPTNFQSLQDTDTDLGSISLVIMQPPKGSSVANLGMQVGKDAKLRLINLDNMSGQTPPVGPGHTGGELQLLNVPQGGGGMREQPATWVDSKGTTWLFVANGNGLSGLTLGLGGTGGTMPQLSSVWQKSGGTTSPIVANGILYSFSSCSGGTCIVGRDPATGNALWTSEHVSSPHWQSPIIVDGVIYAIDNSSKLWAFHLPTTHTVTPTAGDNGAIDPSTPVVVDDGETTNFTVTPDAHYQIAGVTGCDGSLADDIYTTGPITADCNVDATFSIITHVVTPAAVDGSEGSIDPSTPQTVDDGDTTMFTVTPIPPYVINAVTGCDGTLDGNTYTTGAIAGDCTVTATFGPDPGDTVFQNGFDPS